MTCQAYQNAAEAVKQAVIQSLKDDVNMSEFNKLLDHYKGLRRIADKHLHFQDDFKDGGIINS